MSANQWQWVIVPPQKIGNQVWQAIVGKRVFMVIRQRSDNKFYTYYCETRASKPIRFGARCPNLQQAEMACHIKLKEILRMQTM